MKDNGGRPSLMDLTWAAPDTRRGLVNAVASLQLMMERTPQRLAGWYMLCDYLTRLGKIAEALDAAERAMLLAPKDPRSAYVLASTYRMLTRAQYTNSGQPTYDAEDILDWEVSPPVLPVPDEMAAQLEGLGITVEEAARQASFYFKRTLELGLPDDEQPLVKSHLAALATEFPATADATLGDLRAR